MVMAGKVIEATVAANYEDEYYGDDYGSEYYTDKEIYETVEADSEYADYAPTMKSLEEDVTEPTPIPACCGGELWLNPFNAAKKACVYDYESEQRKVVSLESLEY